MTLPIIIALVLAAGILLNALFAGFNTLTIIYLCGAVLLSLFSLPWSKKFLRYGVNIKRDKILTACIYFIVIVVITTSSMFLGGFRSTKYSNYANKAAKMINNSDYKNAEKLLLRLYKENPSNFSVNENLAVVYLKLGRLDLVKNYLEAANSIKPDNEVTLFNLGMMYYQSKDYNNAEICFEKSAMKNPDNQQAFIYTGYMDYLKRSLPKAIYYFESALKVSPDSPEILTHLGRCYTELSEYEKAKQYFSEALTKKPSSELKSIIDGEMTKFSAYGGNL